MHVYATKYMHTDIHRIILTIVKTRTFWENVEWLWCMHKIILYAATKITITTHNNISVFHT